MKSILIIILTIVSVSNAGLIAERVVLDNERIKDSPDAFTFTVGKEGSCTIQFSSGEAYLVNCSPETAAIVFWKKAKAYMAEKVSGPVQPTHIQFGQGKKSITVNLENCSVRWRKHKKMFPESREFWDQVVLVGRELNAKNK